MAKWKLFGKSKEDKKSYCDEEKVEDKEEKIQELTVVEEEEIEEDEDKSLAEYDETIYSGNAKRKKSKKEELPEHDQRIWRDVNSIEKKIDTLHIARAKKPISEVDKKVDRIISDVDIEKSETHKKLPNVIYVVSKPQPGERRGDWAVRSHNKIFSHHKTKQTAINAARKIARKKEGTVLIQNTDGTFSEGFKPRKKK